MPDSPRYLSPLAPVSPNGDMARYYSHQADIASSIYKVAQLIRELEHATHVVESTHAMLIAYFSYAGRYVSLAMTTPMGRQRAGEQQESLEARS